MTARYQEKHYEDVARILAVHDVRNRPTEQADSGRHRPIMAIAVDFANLFAADNPGCPTCFDRTCSRHEPARVGFNRERFLAACGLES